jgi:hypothetical protein
VSRLAPDRAGHSSFSAPAEAQPDRGLGRMSDETQVASQQAPTGIDILE